MTELGKINSNYATFRNILNIHLDEFVALAKYRLLVFSIILVKIVVDTAENEPTFAKLFEDRLSTCEKVHRDNGEVP